MSKSNMDEVTNINGEIVSNEKLRLAREESEKLRHQCEVASLFRMYHEELLKYGYADGCEKKAGKRITFYLYKVEQVRGAAAAKRLREDTLKAIKEKKYGKNKT